MNHSNILFCLLFLIVIGCQSNDQNADDAINSEKPNIVLLFTDDQTYESINALGYKELYTPNLDRLVRNGTSFTHAYNMGGWHGAVCVASRSMIISGASIWRAKEKEVLWNKGNSLAIDQTWGRIMAANGYDTYMTGKWHVQAPSDEVFEDARHERPGMPGDRRDELGDSIRSWYFESRDMKDWNDYMPIGYARPLDESDDSWLPTDSLQGGFWEGGVHWSEVVKNDALDFLKIAATKEDPFFMYLAFNAPHDPRQAPQEYLDKYPVDNIELPASFLPEYPWKDSIGNQPSLRDEALAPYPRTKYAVKKHRQEYYAIISHLDSQVGLILDALEATGKMNNTYVFFTSDHGLSAGQHGLIGKQSLFDHSIRVPLMVVGPDIPKNKIVNHDVYLQDIMATSLEVAGIEKPPFVEFKSFMNLVNEESENGNYDAIYGCYMDLQRMIRKDGFKLLIYPRVNKIFLFDLHDDPEEMNNLADNKENDGKVKSLFKDLMRLQKEMGDELDLTDMYSAL